MNPEEVRKLFWCDAVTAYIKSREGRRFSNESRHNSIETADYLLEEFDKRFSNKDTN